MVKFILSVVALFITININAQSIGAFGGNDWSAGWSEYAPQKVGYQGSAEMLKGVVSANMTLKQGHTYSLVGQVEVKEGVTLTIEPGTIIKGDLETKGSLLINKGATLLAEGTPLNPIVFTSDAEMGERKAGDWGGIVLLGKSYVNSVSGVALAASVIDKESALYGGNENTDRNKLGYVRIEYAGANKMPSLFLGALANTKLENIQVSHSSSEGIYVSGGSLNIQNFIAFNNAGDDVEVTNGAEVALSHANLVRHPLIEDITTSQAIEVSGYSTDVKYKENSRLSKMTVSNVNMITTHVKLAGFNNKEAVAVSKGATLEVTNSLAQNFKNFIYFIDADKYTYENVKAEKNAVSLFDTAIGFKTNPINENLEKIGREENKVVAVGYSDLFEDVKSSNRYKLSIKNVQFTAGNE